MQSPKSDLTPWTLTLTSCQLPISSHHFWVGATANPPKSDDWKWATDKRLLKKSTF